MKHHQHHQSPFMEYSMGVSIRQISILAPDREAESASLAGCGAGSETGCPTGPKT